MFGVEYDLDIFPFWARYYLDMNFDSYHLFLHRENGSIGRDIKKEVLDRGFTYDCADGPQANGMLRRLLLGNYASQLPANDFLVVADLDEFHSNPETSAGCTIPKLPEYRTLLSKYDIVSGFLCDRYAYRLEACYENPFYQYHREEFFEQKIFNNFTPDFLRSTVWPDTRRTKILAARAGYDVAYAGSHCLTTIPSNAKVIDGYHVHHFAWRESAKRKTAVKTYYTSENLREVECSS